ncbi:MAG: hypothetical protein RR672_12705, partial [Raoultibacter sp.]
TVRPTAQSLVLTVEANSLKSVYTGYEQEVKGVKYNNGDVTENGASVVLTIEGKDYTVSGMSASASGIDVADTKVVEVVGKLTVIDSMQNDVSDQFTVQKKNGSLTIDPRKVTITANTNPVGIPYDFSPHTLAGYWVSATTETGGIVSGEALYPSSTDVAISGTEVGIYTLNPADFPFTVTKQSNLDSTKNYDFEFIPGTMEIIAPAALPKVTLQAKSSTVVYNGVEQKVQGLEKDTFTHEGKTYVVEADVSAKRTEQGTTATEVTPGSIVVRDQATSTDVTSKFDVTITPGALTINKRPVIVEASDGFKTFDNTPLYASGYEVREPTTPDDGLLSGDTLTAQVSGSQTLPGSSPSTVVEGSVAIANGSGVSVLGNYAVTRVNGTLTVGHDAANLVLNVVANSADYVYNGSARSVSGLTYNGVAAAASGDSVKLVVDGETFTVSGMSARASGTNVADSTSVDVTGACTILNELGIDMTQQFTVNRIPGKFTIAPRPVTITAGSAEKDYDGRPLTDSRWSAEQALPEIETGLIEQDHLLGVTVSGSQTTPGTSPNVPSGAVFANGMAENYLPVYAAGTLKVKDNGQPGDRVIDIVANSATVTYNGAEQAVEGLTYNGSDSTSVTFDGVTFEISGLSAQAAGTAAGTYPTAFDGRVVVTDPSGNNVTNMFTINQLPGSLVIEAAPLAITAASGQKVYDGSPLVNTDYSVEGLLEGDVVNSVAVVGSQTEVGSSANVVSKARVQHDGIEVTSNYSLAYTDGTLTVLAAAPTPTTPVTPLPTPDPTPVPTNPVDVVVQPVAEALANAVETVINPNPTPQAGTGNENEEVAVDENGTPLGLADHDP